MKTNRASEGSLESLPGGPTGLEPRHSRRPGATADNIGRYETAARSPMSPALRFTLTFAALVIGGMGALLTDTVDKSVVLPFTEGLAALCAAAIRLCGGSAIAIGRHLQFVSGCGGVTVENGCNAIEVSILFAAAILAYPAPARRRLVGAIFGVSLLQGINLVRIISLLYLSCHSKSWFDLVHLYFWDAVIMLDGLVIFLIWQRWQAARRPA
jgi:exosortase H (IPTLxxWG-CTERM-specific)